MEVGRLEWKKIAIKNMAQFIHRGGDCKGDEPQLIGGADLLNTIGVAMGLPTCNPENWSKSEMEKALKGQLVYFKNKAREAIDVIANQSRNCCGGDDRIYVTVLPIELYFYGKLYELPLFKVKRKSQSQNYYIDNKGRFYHSRNDWYENNKLPPGEMAYPTGLKLSLTGGKEMRVSYARTPCDRLGAKVQVIDDVNNALGLAIDVVEIFQPLNLGFARKAMDRIIAHAHDIAKEHDVAKDANVSGVPLLNMPFLRLITIINWDNFSKSVVLRHMVSIAFWTKGSFCYHRHASIIIKDAQNYVFAYITEELTPEETRQLNALRNWFQNDGILLGRFYVAIVKANISAKMYLELLIFGMNYYDTVSNLTPEQINAFEGVRNYVTDDVCLISNLRRISMNYNLDPMKTLKLVANMWQNITFWNLNDGSSIVLRGGNLILGRAPPMKIDQLPQLSPPMIKFIGKHLSRADAVISRQWSESVPILLKLQSHGMFTVCPVLNLVSGGRAVVSLNGHLEISIYKLHTITVDDCIDVLRRLGGLTVDIASLALPSEVVQLCMTRHRLRFECHRRESVAQVAQYVWENPPLLELVLGDLRNHERDRLYTLLQGMELSKANLYTRDMFAFVSDMRPNNINELVSYCEFVMAYVGEECLLVKQEIDDGALPLPSHTKKTVGARKEAINRVFRDTAAMRKKYDEVCSVVQEMKMVGTTELVSRLSESTYQLVAAVRRERITFDSAVSATYHVSKSPTSPVSAYVFCANQTIRNAAWRITVGQDGDRSIYFEDEKGKCVLLERDDRVFLCSFKPLT